MTLSKIKLFEMELEREICLERVETILSNSPPILREKVDWIRNTFEDEWRRSIVARYKAATIIRDIYNDVNENSGAVYGAKAVEAIQKVFGWDDGVIYRALLVADAFTPEQIDAITTKRMTGGRPLSYSHVVALARVEDESHREKLLKQTVKEGWTAQKLSNAAAVSSEPKLAKPDRRGRPLAKPKTFDAVLDQQAHFAEDFLNRNTMVWSSKEHGLSAKVADLDTSDFTQERADRLKRHAEVMSVLAEKAKERAEEAKRIHTGFIELLAHGTIGRRISPKEICG